MFWQRKKEACLGDVYSPPILQPKKPKSKKQKTITFISCANVKHECVLFDVVELDKYKSIENKFVYIVSVIKVGDKKVTPYLKYINKSYCTDATIDLSKIEEKYLDYDWMKNNEEAQRIKRIGTERALQEKDGGEILP